MGTPPPTILDIARSYVEAGLSIIPIRAREDDEDKGKRPAVASWKDYQTRLPTDAELEKWFGDPSRPVGVAIVCGAVSGHFEVIDFDDPDVFEPWVAACREGGAQGLGGKLVIGQSPRGAQHVYYRVDGPVGPRKIPARFKDNGVRIETRSEGEYVCVYPTPGECHPSGKPYRIKRGSLTNLSVITTEQRDALIAVAALFNEYEDTVTAVGYRSPRGTVSGEYGVQPGDDFNARGDIVALLERHQWRCTSQQGDKTIWTRPGKGGRGCSATLNAFGAGIFYVFSTNALPFESCKSYSPFGVYATLEHAGDFQAAARALAAEGFGDPRPSARHLLTQYHAQGARVATVRELPIARAGEDWPEEPLPIAGDALAPFPVEHLPPSIGIYAQEVANRVKVPIDLMAMLGLVVASAVASHRCRVNIGGIYVEPLNLYYMGLMEPGERKTAAVSAMADPLMAIQCEVHEERRPQYDQEMALFDIARKRLEAAKSQAVKIEGQYERQIAEQDIARMINELEQPIPPATLLIDNTTMEKLASLMAEQEDNALAHISDEGGIFRNVAGPYSKAGGSDMDLILKAWSDGYYRVDRIGRPADIIQKASLTIGLAIQPSVLRSLAEHEEFRGRGLLGRFLYNMPESMVGYRPLEKIVLSGFAEAAYSRAIRAIWNIPPLSTPKDRGARHLLLIDGEAYDIHKYWYEVIEVRMRPDGDLFNLRDWAAKLAGSVARIAGVFHLAEHAGDGDAWRNAIDPETVASAWLVGNYLIPHAMAAFGEMAADPIKKLAQRILGWIERNKKATFTLRDCIVGHRGTEKDQIDRALVMLADLYYIRREHDEQEEAGGRRGRPPEPRYATHPRFLEGK